MIGTITEIVENSYLDTFGTCTVYRIDEGSYEHETGIILYEDEYPEIIL